MTVGHGTASREELVALLRGAGVEALVDVRTAPGSRRNPQVSRAEISRWLPEDGVDYRWDKRLGGWRAAPADSPDVAVRNRSFAGYAAHMRAEPFQAAVDELLAQAARSRTAVMCAEAMWWRCHRRMIADFVLLVCDVPVCHLMPDGRKRSHYPMDAARRRDGMLIYDAGQPPLPG